MVNVIVDPLSDHVGYHLLHWIISQSGAWYSKVNENLQDNLRSLETGVAVIDDILTPKEEEIPYENQQHVEAEEPRFHQGLFQNNDNGHHINILNQIINMNVNYNESSLESRSVSFRRNPPSGNCFHENCTTLKSHIEHMLDVAQFQILHWTRTTNSDDFAHWTRLSIFPPFCLREKMDNFKFFIQ